MLYCDNAVLLHGVLPYLLYEMQRMYARKCSAAKYRTGCARVCLRVLYDIYHIYETYVQYAHTYEMYLHIPILLKLKVYDTVISSCYHSTTKIVACRIVSLFSTKRKSRKVCENANSKMMFLAQAAVREPQHFDFHQVCSPLKGCRF